MSTRDSGFDVVFVPRSDLPALPTTTNPMGVLRAQVPTPFHNPWGTPFDGHAVAVTVVNALDEPVEAVGAWWSSGGLAGRPQVRVDGRDVPTPAPETDTGRSFGWIDPPGDDDLVAVGSWLSSDVLAQPRGPYVGANLVLHLRCTDSGVDLLVGGVSNHRPFGEGVGGWNPYWVALYEPGELADHPEQSVYSRFFDVWVNSGRDTSADVTGTSAAGTVSFLARAPDPRANHAWHILLVLGPRPIGALWNETPVPATPAYVAARLAADTEDGVNRFLTINTSFSADGPTQVRLSEEMHQLVVEGMTAEQSWAAFQVYARRLKARADSSGG